MFYVNSLSIRKSVFEVHEINQVGNSLMIVFAKLNQSDLSSVQKMFRLKEVFVENGLSTNWARQEMNSERMRVFKGF